MVKYLHFDQPVESLYENKARTTDGTAHFSRLIYPMRPPKQRFSPLLALLLVKGCAPSPALSPHEGRSASSQSPEIGSEFATESGVESQEVEVETLSATEQREGTRAPPEELAANGENPPLLALPSQTKVLHVGDSFAGALGLPLGKLLEAEGVSSVLKHTDSSYLTDWAWDGKFQKYIWRYNPDLVLITLGGNELEIPNPERREKTVKKIISQIGDRPCIWIGVPLWKGPQNGLLDVIEKHSSPCVYMDTAALFDLKQMTRMKDGIHPTKAARQKWAETVLLWLKQHRRGAAEKPWSIRP